MDRNSRPGPADKPSFDAGRQRSPADDEPTIDELLEDSDPNTGASPDPDFTDTGTFEEIEILVPPEALLSDETGDDEP